MKASRSEFVTLRKRRHHVRLWGDRDAGSPVLFLLHGWQDFSASFQFLVDALPREWCCIAPDWRGFGQSQWNHDGYWFPDYLADLDGLLDHYSPTGPVRLVGHSMGGNVACVYAGVRPGRVLRLATLEGFGLPASDPSDAPGRYAQWLDQLRAPPVNRDYADHDALALRLRRLNPRLSMARAAFLAQHFGVVEDVAQGSGRVVIASDPYHKLVAPYPYRFEEAKACWRRVTAPVLWVEGQQSTAMKMYQSLGDEDYQARLACFQNLRRVSLEDAGHNLHHDQPERLAALLEEFMA
ncbi:MAG: alpha/beta hydrolase [Sterolibacterium sp.]|nr:alpha/beta hydrolase [Sterolibacterium sp.]MBP9798590.1 alpha/beta hydrolase [Sterolibacterium sp.]